MTSYEGKQLTSHQSQHSLKVMVKSCCGRLPVWVKQLFLILTSRIEAALPLFCPKAKWFTSLELGFSEIKHRNLAILWSKQLHLILKHLNLKIGNIAALAG